MTHEDAQAVIGLLIQLLWYARWNFNILCVLVVFFVILKLLTLYTNASVLRMGREVHDAVIVSRGYQQIAEREVIRTHDKIDVVEKKVEETKTGVDVIRQAVADGGPPSGDKLPCPPLPPPLPE